MVIRLIYVWPFHFPVMLLNICVVFLFCFSSSCVPDVASSLDCSFLITPSVFSNIYLAIFIEELKANFCSVFDVCKKSLKISKG